jgi:predicted nucleic acid-binding protein
MVNLTTRDYHHVLEDMTREHLTGGLIYDGLIYQAAIKSGADKLLTLNKKDFEHFNGESEITIISP